MIIINRKKRHRLDCRKGQSPLYINFWSQYLRFQRAIAFLWNIAPRFAEIWGKLKTSKQLWRFIPSVNSELAE